MKNTRCYLYLALVLFLSSNLFGKEFFEKTRLQKETKKICKSDPKAQLAVVLQQQKVYREKHSRQIDRKPPKDRFFYAASKVDLPALESKTHYVGKYFRILEGETDSPVVQDCRNLRASNVYFHLNYIHEIWQRTVFPFLPPDALKNLESHYPIDIRINVTKLNQHINKFSAKEFMTNYVVTTCGHIEKTDKFRLVEKPEILFYKPSWSKGKLSWAPLCFVNFFKNQAPCASDSSIDFSLVPGTIFHEYSHLVTDKFLDSCRGNMMGEAYGVFVSLLMNPQKKLGYGLPSGINHHMNQTSFDKKIPLYSEKVELVDKLWISKEGTFSYLVLGKYYESLVKEKVFTSSEAYRIVIRSAFELRSTNGNIVPMVKHLPDAMAESCKIVPNKLAQCLARVKLVSLKHFNQY